MIPSSSKQTKLTERAKRIPARMLEQWRQLPVLLLACAVLPPATDANTEPEAAYRLRPLDLVTIQVFGEGELSKEVRIDGSGQVRMGLIGTIGLSGLTLEEAEDKLEKTYVEERYLREPQISIEVKEYAPLYVNVFGQVAKPGRVQLEGEELGVALIDLVSAVGGFTGLAKSDAVRITRTDSTGRERTVTVNAGALINGQNADIPSEFLTLQPGDVVFVPERLF